MFLWNNFLCPDSASFELQMGTPQSGHSSLCLTTLSKYFEKNYFEAQKKPQKQLKHLHFDSILFKIVPKKGFS
jgi:hypothetical protein